MATIQNAALSRSALSWYRENQRVLPWRQTRDPYSIWVSEIMLQQTQVSTVIPFYHRFLGRFPNPTSLAGADEDAVFQLWAGLGYYRRARQLHAAAKKIVEEHNGIFPRQLDHVRALPGVGRYTAHAILSFAFDERLGIVEANTQRLYARLLHLQEPMEASATQKKLWEFANRIVPSRNCGEFNQAMMEIGSQICTPRNPACETCPLFRLCPTGQRGHTARVPPPKPPKNYTDVTEAVVLLKNTSAQWLVRRCGESERWAGLWDFPRFDITGNEQPSKVADFLRRSMLERFQFDVDIFDSGHSLRHAVTRYRIRLLCFWSELRAEQVDESLRSTDSANLRWLSIDELQELAWNASAKRIVQWLEKHRHSLDGGA